MIQRVQECNSPCVKRILAEEVFEATDWIVYLSLGNGRYSPMEKTELWNSYKEAALAGRVVDFYYIRYQKAKQFVERWLDHSYLDEFGEMDDKSKRYAYALSGRPLPEWFREDLLVPRLELIVTVYCHMLITILDYAEEYALAVA